MRSQIDFKRNARNSDHLLTLKSMIKKYVTYGHKKIYTCIVDLKKTLDSIPHKLLFQKLSQLGPNGNMLILVENIYKKSKCAVKGERDKITHFLNYTKGVRQGCPVSPLFFNLYINQAINNIDNACKIPIPLNNSAY